MALDAELRRQLIEARSRITAQLDEIRFRVLSGNPHGGGGPPNYESIVVEFQDELSEINRLLGSDADEDHS